MTKRKMLVTAGSTATNIDKVRIVTNIFKGRTGETIALAAADAGWDVTLLTSRPAPEGCACQGPPMFRRIRYRTFDELAGQLERHVVLKHYDAIVHSAAVSDYRPVAVHHMDDDGQLQRLGHEGSSRSKIPSTHDRLFIEMLPTYKLIDCIRNPWGFKGKLVKFKLQVDMGDEELISIAGRSIRTSDADWIVANCLEWSADWAYIIGKDGTQVKVERKRLPDELLGRLA